jgi:hypothetical protein
MQIKVTHILPQYCLQICGSHPCCLSLACSSPTIPLWKKKKKKNNNNYHLMHDKFWEKEKQTIVTKEPYIITEKQTHQGNKLRMIHKPSTLEPLNSVTHKTKPN